MLKYLKIHKKSIMLGDVLYLPCVIIVVFLFNACLHKVNILYFHKIMSHIVIHRWQSRDLKFGGLGPPHFYAKNVC